MTQPGTLDLSFRASTTRIVLQRCVKVGMRSTRSNGETHGERSVAHGGVIPGQHRHGSGDRTISFDVQVTREHPLGRELVRNGELRNPARDLERTVLVIELLGNQAPLGFNGRGGAGGQLRQDIRGQHKRRTPPGASGSRSAPSESALVNMGSPLKIKTAASPAAIAT